MEKSDSKTGKIALVFAAVCLAALPLVVLAAFSFEAEPIAIQALESPSQDFDHNGAAIFISQARIAKEYLAGVATDRTLNEYYSRRQYLGAPPVIPHKVEPEERSQIDCLSCHAKGGWTEGLKRNTPLTPHPDQTACTQCHVEQTTDNPFMENLWVSTQPPRLGRAYLPGAPPPIPHGLQMRADCMACHVGPGAVTAIRVEHSSRGNCRQCHVPDAFAGLFERES